MSAAIPSAGTGVWSIVSGTLTIDDVNSVNAFVSNIQPGVTVLRWTVRSICIVFDEMQILRSEPPSTAVAGLDQEICDSITTLAAETPLVGTGVWTIESGNATIADPNDPLSSVSGITPGTVVLRWTVSSGSCADSFDNNHSSRPTS